MFALVAGTRTTTLLRGFFWEFWLRTRFMVRGGSTPYILSGCCCLVVVAGQVALWDAVAALAQAFLSLGAGEIKADGSPRTFCATGTSRVRFFTLVQACLCKIGQLAAVRH